ncbi:MAG: mechanosensitive ion channel domain-containing protein [Pseudomonadota bacterium]
MFGTQMMNRGFCKGIGRVASLFGLFIALGAAPANAQAVDAGAASEQARPSATTGANGLSGEAEPPQTTLSEISTRVFPTELRAAVARLPLELERLQKAADRLGQDGVGLQQVRADAEALSLDARNTIAGLEPLIPLLEVQRKSLGDAPKDGDPPEIESLTIERQRLDRDLGALTSALKQTRLAEIRINQLLSRLQSARSTLLAQDLVSRTLSPFSPIVWHTVSQHGARAGYQFLTVVTSWFSLLSANPFLLAGILLATALGYLAVGYFATRYRTRRMNKASRADPPLGFLRRAWLAGSMAIVFSVPSAAALGIFAGAIWAFDLTNTLIDPIINVTFKALLIIIAVQALSRAVLLPRYRTLRLLGVDDAGARRLHRIVCLMAIASGVDLILAATIDALLLSAPFAVVAGALTTVIFAVLLVLLVTTPIVEVESRQSGRLIQRLFARLRGPVFAVAFAIAAATLLGYLTLGRFIVGQVMLIGVGGLILFLINRSLTSLAKPTASASGLVSTNRNQTAAGRLDRANDDEDDDGEGRSVIVSLARLRLADILALFVHAALLSVGLAAIIVSWGFSFSDLGSWARTMVVGFTVGGVRISPAQIIGAIGLFLGLLLLTRLLQRWLSNTVLRAKNMEPGLANSIHTGIGYAGSAIALLIGVSYAGLDITNLAIVAGALSVGIGFGLQSIVNNFVSGLILLIERPVKVGDWIVVGENQGYVRRISVRSTEIETFDRASLILPNSELITGIVQNWTHRNAIGRVVVPIGVSYNADPDQTMQIVRQAVKGVKGLLMYPEPTVHFEDFADSSLNFTIRAFAADVNKSLSLKTAIRVAVFNALKEADIEIPFPQQDLHLRDLDGLKSSLTQAMRSRAPTGEQGAGPEQAAETGTASERWSEAETLFGGLADFSPQGRSESPREGVPDGSADGFAERGAARRTPEGESRPDGQPANPSSETRSDPDNWSSPEAANEERNGRTSKAS